MSKKKKLPPNEFRRREYLKWCDSRPPHVAAIARKFEPWRDYILATTCQTCQIVSFEEHKDGKTVTVKVRTRHALMPFIYEVFGVPPEELMPATEN